jgi:hypothetical protein
MFANHVYNGNLTYGDLFRMLKYCKLFGSWDTASHTRNYVIAPNKLTVLFLFRICKPLVWEFPNEKKNTS